MNSCKSDDILFKINNGTEGEEGEKGGTTLNFEDCQTSIRKQLNIKNETIGGGINKNGIKGRKGRIVRKGRKVRKGGGISRIIGCYNKVHADTTQDQTQQQPELINLSKLPNDILQKITASISVIDNANLEKIFEDLPVQHSSDEEPKKAESTLKDTEDKTRCSNKNGISDYDLMSMINGNNEKLNRLKEDKIFLWSIIKDIISNTKIDKNKVIAVFFLLNKINLKF